MAPLEVVAPKDMKKKLPVTLISGFLGSGKTTLLQHILRSKDHGLRCAVIVNDMAEINIDGAVVENSQLIQREEKLIQMQNGCICCTLREDLLEEINRLAAENKFDYLLIESTGISEPMQVAETFTADFSDHLNEQHNEEEQEQEQEREQEQLLDGPEKEQQEKTMQALQSLSENARLDTCVSMVDASSFYGYLNSSKFLVEQFDDAEDEDEKTVVDLLVDQIEFADVILLNKIDTCTPEKVKKIEQTLRGLNPTAKIVRCQYSKIDVKEILNTGLFDMEKAMTSAGWLKSLKEEIVPETLEYGISSFVYRQRRPFHPQRLFDLIKQAFLVLEDGGAPENEPDDIMEDGADETDEDTEMMNDEEPTSDIKSSFNDDESEVCFQHKSQSVFQRVFRSKGFLWLAGAGKDKCMGEWSQAGIIVTISNSGRWYVDNPEDMEALDDDMKNAILADFDPQNPKIGDKRQEIVFIGDFEHEQEKQALISALDQCLMQDGETVLATQDPFEEWH